MATTRTRRSRGRSALPVQLAELAVAAPQVVAHRVARMAQAGPVLSARDRREFTSMVMEKQAAFVQSWQAMTTEFYRAQWRLAMGAWSALWQPWPLTVDLPSRLSRQWGREAYRITSRGVQPVHRKATANARRLSRKRSG